MTEFEEIINKTNILITKLNSYYINSEMLSVYICGSSKFCDLIAVIKWELEKQYIITTGLHLLPKWYINNKKLIKNHHIAEQENISIILDKLHLRKIDMHNCIVVVNLNNYIGERTAIEIDFVYPNYLIRLLYR